GLLGDRARELEPEPAAARLADERGRERMWRELVERRRELQHLGLAEPVEGDEVLDTRRAERKRAGLVEDDRARTAELLDHTGSLDDDPGARGARDARE